LTTAAKKIKIMYFRDKYLVAKTIFNELYQALNMKKIMKKNPLRKYKFPCPFFISPILNCKNSLIAKWHKLVNKSI
jgi:hypothetical protein